MYTRRAKPGYKAIISDVLNISPYIDYVVEVELLRVKLHC